jgi:hypothetical protein
LKKLHIDKENEKEITEINQAIYTFSLEMTDKMLLKLDEGYTGWNDPACEANIMDGFSRQLLKYSDYLLKGKDTSKILVNIANYSMILHRLKTKKNE